MVVVAAMAPLKDTEGAVQRRGKVLLLHVARRAHG